MAIRIVQAMWRFDADSLLSLRAVMDRIIKQKQGSERSFTETVNAAGQLKLSYRRQHERHADIETVGVAVVEASDNPNANGDGHGA